MSVPRFLAPALDPGQREVTLPPDESRHLIRVLRLGTGARIAVFDGSGREFLATVVAASRDRVTVRLEEPVKRASAPRVAVVLAQAILKGDKMDDVVRDATMLGVSGIVPLMSEHVSVRAAAIRRGAPENRWRRIAVASAKQCSRSTVPVIQPAVPLFEWLAASGAGVAGPGHRPPRLFLIEPNRAPAQSLRSVLGAAPPSEATIVVGPEGGWSAREVAAAVSAGCVPVRLGGLTLRADAAALVALSALWVLWGETGDQEIRR